MIATEDIPAEICVSISEMPTITDDMANKHCDTCLISELSNCGIVIVYEAKLREYGGDVESFRVGSLGLYFAGRSDVAVRSRRGADSHGSDDAGFGGRR